MKQEAIALVELLVVFVVQADVIVQNKIPLQFVAPHTPIQKGGLLLVLIVKPGIIVLIVKVLKNVLLGCILFLVPQVVHYVLQDIFVQDLQS